MTCSANPSPASIRGASTSEFNCLRRILLVSLFLSYFLSAFALNTRNIFGQELSQHNSATEARHKQTITKVLTVQATAWNEANIDKFMETYWKSDKLTFSSGGSTTRGWQATLDHYKQRYPTPEKMGKLHFDELEITLIEQQSALVLGKWHLKFSDGSRADGNFSLVVIQMEGQWKIIHDHSSSLEAKSE